MRLLEEIRLLYFEDFDPSRDDMDDKWDNAFRYRWEDIDFHRIAMTEEQIEILLTCGGTAVYLYLIYWTSL
jgi:hypothetical protein